MSNDQVHRPRRLIPPSGPLPETTATRALAERFARSLAGAGARQGAARTPRQPAKAAEPDRDQPREVATSATRPQPVPPRSEPRASAAAVAPVRVADAAVGSTRDAALREDPPPPEPASLRADSPPIEQEDWGSELVKRIAIVCRASDPAFQTWVVSLPLDESVLPQTQLRLHMSPHQLSLRFQTDSAASLRLISTHSPRLAGLLERSLPQPRDVDIDVV